MEKFEGKSIFNGVAIGPIFFYEKVDHQVKRTGITDVEAEVARFRAACVKAQEQLESLYEKALIETGEEEAAIFEAHKEMLEEGDMFDDQTVEKIETEKVNAEYAAAIAGDNCATMFANMDSEYMQGRAADVKDIANRVINILMGVKHDISFDKPVIIVADDLAPSETVQMDKTKLLGFALESGSTSSHTAILARTMNIPAVTKIKINHEWNGRMGIIDGFNGDFYVDPDAATIKRFEARQAEVLEERRLLQELKGKEDVTKSGRHLKLYANIGGVGDVASVLDNDAQGVGLFRSEFLYLESNDYPSEDVQFQAYRQVAELMAGKKVIIRTLDIGADKQADYFKLPKEENPAMGYRAIRICLTRTDVFKTQLRALYRASAFGNIAIMYPMIISLEEVRRIKAISAEVRAELDAVGFKYGKYGKVEEGIMIETPAAAIMSDVLAKEVDFFSIGSNDLTQYTLAIDRQNNLLDQFFDPHHPAILRLIKMVCDNAHAAGIWAGICGELGADLTLTEDFIRMGVDELSVSPSLIFPIRKIVRNMN